MHPPIQIVDSDDNPTGILPIGEAHKKGAIHRVVRIMVEDPKSNKVLLQKRSPNMQSWPNAWDNSAAGHVDEGEDYLTAAKRELAEELGVVTDVLEEIEYYYSENKRQDGLLLKRFNKLYKFLCDDSQQFILQESEVSEVKWFSVDEIKKMVNDSPDKVTDGLKYVVEKHYS